MVDFGGPSSKRVQGEGFEKDKRKKRVVTCVRYTSFAKSCYQITYAKLVGYEKSDMVNKFRADVGLLVHDSCKVNWESWRDVPEEIRTCNYTLDDTNEELMKLMEKALRRVYKQWHYDVEWNGGPAEQ
ncbi:hypothetical protein D8674_017468 [Pyrus ussuriensis x Pyrus communis]|uniref:Uncharacterized protein n=1 Tax=Pyrus ussuriensis x Pyrus communis TaxID=2448454 RepID=A0A5N5HDT7_9ROSA|nr:hypothetical protein D8674_017468 [Pyrus ussuriensis x Pyrus communis]